ncbi:type IV secretion system protein [Paralysiella testudinis]|uniref:Conjugal transfer protein TraF n=1 Tax=Paralysiella testudinis TaxID=2809020 RepID=A0A892ZK82_9NEIS|nr:type IV secretion system protein [Paralysiella testudinis]QRQ82828.1 conjugal transfer protein TraF [Paralysiella testudinis]
MQRFNKNRLTKLAAILISGSLMLSPIAATAGIPVTDAGSIAQAIQQGIQLKEQIDNQIKQITELKSQVQALTGTRNMGNLLKDTVKDQVPDEWKDLYNSATGTNYKELLKGKDYKPEDALRMLTSNYSNTIKAFEDTKKRLKNIEGLMKAIDGAQDMKAAADLQNRLAAEQAIVQNNQVKLDMMARYFEMQKEIQSAQRVTHTNCQRAKKFGWDTAGC